MSLNGPEVRKLRHLIRDSFRTRHNQRPLYVAVGDHLERIAARQHQVIFGRRGAGKSCLLVHYLHSTKKTKALPVYLLADEYKRLGYPDILIRLLVEILEKLPIRRRFLKWATRRPMPTLSLAKELRRLLDEADEADVREDASTRSTRSGSATIRAEGVAQADLARVSESTQGRSASFKTRKLDYLERHLKDYKDAIHTTVTAWHDRHACVVIDDFYLLPREWHADVLDYLHRLLRDTDAYLKVATVRHRTTLSRNHPQTIGVEPSQDVEVLDLDRTLEDLDATQSYLSQMLHLLGEQAGIPEILISHLNPEAPQWLALTSGGVPRDFLTIFDHAVDAALAEGKERWITPKYVYKGAARLTWQTKLKTLREDVGSDADGLERVFADLLEFCLKEKKKTAFLLSQDEAQTRPEEHEWIRQLMDFKLVHIVEPDTSAASGRPGRYEAYTLDFSLFLEPRRRKIEIVEFWKIDENRRRTGIRESPVYPLERARTAFTATTGGSSPRRVLEDADRVEEVQATSLDSRRSASRPRPQQPGLFDDAE